MTSEPVLWLRGERVGLGPTHAELIEEYWRWENDPVTVNGYGRQVPESLETRREGYGHQARGSLNQVRFTIHDLKNEATACGLTSLTVDHQVRTAEFLILLAPEARGRGLATEATRLTLDYAFHLTVLTQVWLKVLEPNAAAIRAYQPAGFQPTGRLRQAGYWHGQRCDELLMGAQESDELAEVPAETHPSIHADAGATTRQLRHVRHEDVYASTPHHSTSRGVDDASRRVRAAA